VTYATVRRAPLHHTIRAVGTIDPDRNAAGRSSPGRWLCKGFVRPICRQLVEKDAPLMSIYSPDLLTTERELVMLLRMRDQANRRKHA